MTIYGAIVISNNKSGHYQQYQEINMTSKIKDKLEELSEMADNVCEKQPEFKIGDVVESQNSIVAPLSSKGIVIFKYSEDSPPDYDIYWYSSKLSSVFQEDLKLCNGLNNKGLCLVCKYKYLCPYMYEIVNCDISEFSEWRIEGESDHHVCRERKCKHFNICAMKKWLPKEA